MSIYTNAQLIRIENNRELDVTKLRERSRSTYNERTGTGCKNGSRRPSRRWNGTRHAVNELAFFSESWLRPRPQRTAPRGNAGGAGAGAAPAADREPCGSLLLPR
ncbi:hypothetical protein EVAR_43133_1 [Eumeta japonica]|uniref:Uncharacterized protein n=1 Tax=Eumeta variegata TaxID=151549 RepID=A0A4C1XM82_EUMVA|nr:hypothetical protein EVAR_43133_1 [Eumeta japonica]